MHDGMGVFPGTSVFDEGKIRPELGWGYDALGAEDVWIWQVAVTAAEVMG